MTETSPIIIGHRYEQHNLLGMGGMGAVYRATDRLMGQDVALKRVNIPPEFLEFMSRSTEGGPGHIQLALANEFKVLASLRHPNIISVLDYGFDVNRQPYYTMELLRETQTMLSAAKDQAFEFKVMLIIQVMQALTYLHRRMIIHRDLKPENVLIVNGQAKVLDFGLAIAHEFQSVGVSSSSGSIFYMAPEVIDGGVATEAADQYAVGAMAYEMFAGRHPFQIKGIGVSEYGDKVMNERPPLELIDAPPGITEIIGRLLEKRPDARFRNAQEVIAALSAASGISLPNETTEIRESFLKAARFVGRRDELGRLQGALNEALEGKGSSWLIGGESGVGKSRLLDELRAQALVFGALVLRGQGVNGGGRSYELWRDPIRRLVLGTKLTDLEVGILKELVPDIEMLIRRNVPQVPPLSEKANQQRLVATISEMFRRQSEPILLMLEDLQWAVESLSPLTALSEFAEELPLLIVGSYRNDEASKLQAELPGFHPVRLERLTTEDVAELSASMLGPIGEQASVVNLLQRETEGNVFFITEVVRALAEEAGQLEKIDTANLPRSVFAGGMKEIINRRLEQVPELARPLLKLAAVIGRQIDRKLLDVLSDETDLDWWITACNEASVLDIQDEQWRFSYDKLLETLLEHIDPAELRELNKQVALAIETVYLNDESRARMLFDHWYAAQVPEKAVHYAEIAGQKMILVGNYQNALDMLQRAIASATSSETQYIRTVLLRHAGNANFYTGNFPSALEYFTQGLNLARELDYRSEIIVLLGRLGGTNNEQGNYHEARKYCEQGLEIAHLENDHLNVARLEMLIAVSYTNEGKYQVATEYLQRSINYFRDAGEKKLQGDALLNMGVIATYQSEFARARQYWKEALQLSSEIGDSHGICISLNNLGGIANEQSDFKAALTYLQQSLETSRKTGDRRIMSLALDNLGVASQMLGDFEKARVYWQDAIIIVRQINYAPVLLDLFQNLGGLHLIMGEYDQALRDFQEAATIAQMIGRQREYANALRGMADIACEQGDLVLARQYIDQSFQLMRELGNRDLLVNATWVLGKIATLEGNYSPARSLFQDSLNLARDIADPGRTAESLASIVFVSMQLGKVDEAKRDVVEGLRTALSISATGAILHLLAGVALIYFATGYLERSAELYGLCLSHHCTSMYVKQFELSPLHAKLGQSLDAVKLSEAESRGAESELVVVVNEAIEQLFAH